MVYVSRRQYVPPGFFIDLLYGCSLLAPLEELIWSLDLSYHVYVTRRQYVPPGLFH